MKTSTLVVIVLCFMTGVVLFTSFEAGLFVGLWFLMIGGGIALAFYFRGMVSHASFFVSLFFLCVGGGVLWADVAGRYSGDSVLGNAITEQGGRVIIEGTVVDEPDERERFTHLVVETGRIQHEEVFLSVNTKIKVTTDLYPTYGYGDRIVLEGVLDKPKSFETDLGREFDYVGYLAKDGIYYQMFYPDIELVGQKEGAWVKEKLFAFKGAFLSNITKVLHEPYAALAGGLIVGAKQSLGEELLQKFRDVGLIHIIVLSGYNVTIIAVTIMYLLSFLPRIAKVIIGSICIIAFAIMTGAGATIVRASIMAILVVAGKMLGRKIDMLRLLAIAVFFMVLHNPLIVAHDPSFQLSVLATLGLILLPPLFENKISWIPQKFGLREIIVATVSTQIFVLPALMYMTGQISVVSLVVNILVLSVIPITMLFGFLTGLAGFLSTGLSAIFAWGAFIFLYYEVAIVELFARISFASVALPNISPLFVILFYSVFCFTLWRLHERNKKMVITESL
ncbi:MAG: ComEC family competence protein [Candidatus Pacebacteria bacterium]|nr:ComEC family competence protein [Candidatus Paceibacterota bacterium]